MKYDEKPVATLSYRLPATYQLFDIAEIILEKPPRSLEVADIYRDVMNPQCRHRLSHFSVSHALTGVS